MAIDIFEKLQKDQSWGGSCRKTSGKPTKKTRNQRKAKENPGKPRLHDSKNNLLNQHIQVNLIFLCRILF